MKVFYFKENGDLWYGSDRIENPVQLECLLQSMLKPPYDGITVWRDDMDDTPWGEIYCGQFYMGFAFDLLHKKSLKQVIQDIQLKYNNFVKKEDDQDSLSYGSVPEYLMGTTIDSII